MAGANFILSTAGYLEGALCQSFAKFVIDAEQVELTRKFLRGIDFSELDEALSAMAEVEPGGHYLGAKHTLENFERTFVIPELMHHDSFEQWEAGGRQDVNDRAIAKARKMLAEYESPPQDAGIDEELRDFIVRREREIGDALLSALRAGRRVAARVSGAAGSGSKAVSGSCESGGGRPAYGFKSRVLAEFRSVSPAPPKPGFLNGPLHPEPGRRRIGLPGNALPARPQPAFVDRAHHAGRVFCSTSAL